MRASRLSSGVDPTTVTLATGSSTTITASVYDAWGARLETAASWRSSDPTVATVDSTGKITGVRAGTASVVASAGSASSIVTVSVTSLTTVALRSNDLVADASRGRVYASVPSSVGVHGNTIAVIDPVSRTVLAYHFVGSEPSKLALSDDARFLYVALEGAGKVARVDLSNPSGPTVDLTFSLGSVDYYGQRYVEDMAVMPGAPGTVAISLRCKNLSPRHAGVAIYDDGVQRPTMTPGHTGSNVIEFSASGSLLYGLNNETTEFGFRRMQVTASGVTVLTVSAFAAGFGTDIAFGGGLIYGSTGVVYDPEARSIEGTFTGMTSGSIVEASPVGERVLFLASAGASSGPWSLRAFDRGTLVPVGSTPLPGVTSTPASLVRWGSRGIAFRLATTWGVPGEAVYFVETDLAAP